ncbi:hypothetical protein COM06_20015 [Bacillus toyonensis]|uniref:DUF4209 domain-containing protein n=1 Tax=Bacillus toyonensis TaxID=155322 RepID=UPI000BF841D8|nr:DUF4209 domain-containing protein [Bacillus toyonensis]PGB24786.1 hypothetical protein COM06_20015 [Bacillus toyonensis]
MNEMIQNLETVKHIEQMEGFLEIIKRYHDEPNYEYEKMALSLMTGGDYAYDVDSYFTPVYYKQKIYPEKSMISIETLSYWQQRALETSNGILMARYGDLVWNFSKKMDIRVDNVFRYAKIAIQGYISIVEDNLISDPFELKTNILRALQLAKLLNQKEDINKVQQTMLNLEKRISEDAEIGLWGFCFDTLILEDNGSCITIEQYSEIITEINGKFERLLKRMNESGEQLWYAVEYAVKKLLTYYRQNEKEKVTYILKEVEDSIDRSNCNSHLKEFRYQQLYEWYEFAQIHTETWRSRLIKKIEIVAKEGMDSFKEFSYKKELNEKEVSSFISQFITGDIDLDRYTISLYFVPKIDEYEKRIQERSAAGIGVIQQLFNVKKTNEAGLAMATLDMDDPKDQVAKEITFDFQLNSQYLAILLPKFIELYELGEDDFTALLSSTPIHDPQNKELLEVGIKHYLQGDYLSSSHVLIPYIEATLRNIIHVVGGNIYKPNKKGGFDKILLGDILASSELKEILGEDAIFYFKLVYNDVRGYNLRNNMAHGLVSPSYFNRFTIQLIIHTLLMLSTIGPAEEDTN